MALDFRQWLFQFYGSDNHKIFHKGWAVISPADSRWGKMHFLLPSNALVDFVIHTPWMPVGRLQINSWTNSHFGLTYHAGMKTAANSQADPKSLPWQQQCTLESQGWKQQHFWNWCASGLGIATCRAAISLGPALCTAGGGRSFHFYFISV